MKICILGSGILGVISAYYLGQRGHDVLVLDRKGEAARETSFANGGQLSYSHAEPWANPSTLPKVFQWMFKEDAPLVMRPRADAAMMKWGMQFLRNCTTVKARKHSEVLWRLGSYSKKVMNEVMADTQIAFDHIDKGILHVYDSQDAFDHAREQSEYQHAMGCEENAMTLEQCIAMEPSLAYAKKKIYGGIHAPMDESGDVHTFATNLAAMCIERYRATFHYGVHVESLEAKDGKITHIKTSVGDIQADAYVMAMGSYSPIYLKQVGIDVPIYPMKGYSITFPANDKTPTVSITDDNLKIVYSRLGSRIRVAGTAEFAGYNADVRKARIDPIMRGVNALFPEADLSKVDEWACLRPSTPDGPPIIGATPVANLFLNTGHGTLGWTQAAGSGKLLADIIDGVPADIAMDGLSIERYL